MFEFGHPFLTESALEALSEWSAVLKSFQSRIGQHFSRAEARESAFDYLRALLSPVERKNGWQMAEQVGHSNPYRVQLRLIRFSGHLDKSTLELGGYNESENPQRIYRSTESGSR